MWQSQQQQQPLMDFLDPFSSPDPNITHTKLIPPMQDDFWGESFASPTGNGEVTGLSSPNSDLLDVPVTDHGSIAECLGVEQAPPILPETSTQNLLLDFKAHDESSNKTDANPKSELLWFQQP